MTEISVITPSSIPPASRSRLCSEYCCRAATAILFLCGTGISHNLPAQGPQAGASAGFSTRSQKSERRYILDVEVLTQPQATYRINAQKWGAVLQEMGFSVRFRDGRPGEKIRVEDVERVGDHVTHVVGVMESDGRIVFRNQRFMPSSPDSLRMFFTELQLYGAAGPPSVNPTWGLTDEQFKSVTRLLSAPVDSDIEFRSPVQAIESLKLPAVFHLQFTDAARDRSFEVRKNAVPAPDSLKGLSQGTALAIALSQYGLGFRPMVNPAGGYLMEIDVGGESDNFWPVGWKSKEALITLLPSYYKAIPVDVDDDVELKALIDVIADKMQVEVHYSSAALTDAGLNVEELRYSRKPDRLSPARLLQIIGDKFNMGFDIRFDENGKSFLWVTTHTDSLAFRTRFAHVISGQ